jgi:hypothetical protein
MIKKSISKIMNTKAYEYIMLNVIPYIRFSVYYTSIRGIQYHKGYELLRNGDIILTNDKWKLTSFLIPGEWTHAALCVSKNGRFEVAEMTHTNFTESTFFDICKEATRVLILRCRDWDERYISEVIQKCKSFKNAKYDVRFEHGTRALYCSELVISSDFEKRLQASDEDVVGLGMKYVSPTGISKAKNVEVIWDSDKM